MTLETATNKLIVLGAILNSAYPSESEAEKTWDRALRDFDIALAAENNPEELERLVLSDENWELGVYARLELLEKAKRLGANSKSFLLDYYSFVGAHNDPGEEKALCKKMVKMLMAM